MSEQDTGADAPEEVTSEETETAPDPLEAVRQELKNSKSENSRKLENLQAQLAEIASALKPKVAETPIPSSLIYDDPEKYAQLIEERASAKAEARVLGKVQQQNSYQMKVSAMQSDFPEFRDENSEAYRAANSEYQNLPAHLHGTTEGLEIAMQRAALKQGLVPVSKRRKSNSDDYTATTTNTGRRNPPPRESAEDQKALEFAKILNKAAGREFTDKVAEGVKQAAKRKNMSKWPSED